MDKTKAGLVVAQEGNPRGNAVSSEDIKQGILDMANFFNANAPDVADGLKNAKPASADELKKLKDVVKGPLPVSVEVLLSVYNGGFLLKDTYKSLSITQILEAIDLNQVNGYWKKNYIPLAQDEENNYLCVENENGSEVKVVSWCTDIGVIEEVADGLGLLIERTRDGLLKNKIQYVEGAGLIEASG